MELLIFSVLCLCLGWFGFSNLVKARTIEDTPTSKVRSASQGYVELEGLAKPLEGKKLIAPLTGKSCLWFSFKVERYESNGKNSRWRTIESATSDDVFILQDSTGQCHINPTKADFIAMSKQSWRGHGRRPSGPVPQQESTWSFNQGKYRYTEQRLHEEHFLYAIGHFQTLHAPSADQQSKQKMNQLLNQWKQDQQQLLARFDSDGNGEIDANEWQRARQLAAKQARSEVLASYNDAAIHTLSYSTGKRQPFIIAAVDPRTLTKRYRWFAFGCLTAALASGVYVAAMLIQR